MSMKRLSLHHIARIEGHGDIEVSIDSAGVPRVEMHITEAARYFEAMVRGRSFDEVSYISSRICGICSPSHAITSLIATEEAFRIQVSERTRLLRQLLIYGSYLQNHATHLYLLAAPDYIGEMSALPLAESNPAIFERALRIKKLGNELCTVVGGRSIHPITCVVGGFTQEPSRAELLVLADQLHKLVEDCVQTTELFGAFDLIELHTTGDFLSLSHEGSYAIYDGMLHALREGWSLKPSEYRNQLIERPVSYSNAKLSSFLSGQTYMTGALARMNNSWKSLSQQARFIAAKVGVRPLMDNPYLNNICQAIELVDAAERCAKMCERLSDSKHDDSSKPLAFEPCAGSGVGCTEAPRGTLFHCLTYTSDGRVESADVLTPTAQNLGNIERDVTNIIPLIAEYSPVDFRCAIEKLIRAYDPCLSCAVH
jgi:sulfhydrogenase subunit alpha